MCATGSAGPRPRFPAACRPVRGGRQFVSLPLRESVMSRPALLLGLIAAVLPLACNKTAPNARPASAAVEADEKAYDPVQLLNNLKANNADKRRRALEMTREMDEAGQDVVPTLLEALK